MSAYLLKAGSSHNWLYKKTEPWFVALNNGYEKTLRGFFKYRWLGFVLLLLSFGVAYILAPKLPSELAPLEDRSMVGLAVIAPEGTSYESMEETMKAISNYVSDSIPDLNNNRTYAGIAASIGTLVQPVNGGFQWIFLKGSQRQEKWFVTGADIPETGSGSAKIQKCYLYTHTDSNHWGFLQ